jgi:hypothetical protein
MNKYLIQNALTSAILTAYVNDGEVAPFCRKTLDLKKATLLKVSRFDPNEQAQWPIIARVTVLDRPDDNLLCAHCCSAMGHGDLAWFTPDDTDMQYPLCMLYCVEQVQEA